jgi:hypothetical protein
MIEFDGMNPKECFTRPARNLTEENESRLTERILGGAGLTGSLTINDFAGHNSISV